MYDDPTTRAGAKHESDKHEGLYDEPAFEDPANAAARAKVNPMYDSAHTTESSEATAGYLDVVPE